MAATKHKLEFAGHEIGGTLKQELNRTAEMLVDIAEEKGVYFAIALLLDSSYDTERIKALLPVLEETRGSRKRICEGCKGTCEVETGIGMYPCGDCGGRGIEVNKNVAGGGFTNPGRPK